MGELDIVWSPFGIINNTHLENQYAIMTKGVKFDTLIDEIENTILENTVEHTKISDVDITFLNERKTDSIRENIIFLNINGKQSFDIKYIASKEVKCTKAALPTPCHTIFSPPLITTSPNTTVAAVEVSAGGNGNRRRIKSTPQYTKTRK